MVQVFRMYGSQRKTVLLGVVGQLQFEVAVHRLETEYGAEVRMEPAPFTQIRRLPEDAELSQFEGTYMGSNVRVATDADGRGVLLFPDQWSVDYFMEKNKDLYLEKI